MALTSAARFYRPELDVIRFFAFFAVFLDHAVPIRMNLLHRVLSAGGMGVSLFFVLSSFLITELIRLEKARTGTINIPAFYVRRVLRIWPLYFLFIAFAVVVGLVLPEFHVPGKAVAAMMLLSGNWYVVFAGFLPKLLVPLWSISVEEQFYLLWPTLCRFLGKAALIVISIALIPIGAVTIRHLVLSGSNPITGIWVNSFVQFQTFGMGALLAIWLNGRIPSFQPFFRGILFSSALGCFYAAHFQFHIFDVNHIATPSSLILAYLCSGVGSCLLIVSVLGVSISTTFGWLTYLGRISYGLYVFHAFALILTEKMIGPAGNAFMGVAKPVLALLETVALAALSYKYIESPFIRMKDRFTVIKSRPV